MQQTAAGNSISRGQNTFTTRVEFRGHLTQREQRHACVGFLFVPCYWHALLSSNFPNQGCCSSRAMYGSTVVPTAVYTECLIVYTMYSFVCCVLCTSILLLELEPGLHARAPPAPLKSICELASTCVRRSSSLRNSVSLAKCPSFLCIAVYCALPHSTVTTGLETSPRLTASLD